MSGEAEIAAPVFDPILAAKWTCGIWLGGMPACFLGICSDTRRLKKGNLFIALRGERHDGAAFIMEAFRLGASGAMTDSDMPDAPGPVLKVAEVKTALQQFAACYLRHLSPRVVAVTGSVGKTTVKDMVAAVLSATGPTARTPGNWNNEIGLPLSILSIKPPVRHAVFEVGMNKPGELRPLCELLAPECGIVTRIGPVHLEHFESVESIAREKAVLLDCLKPDGTAILCADEPYFEILKSAASGRRIVTVGLEKSADYTARAPQTQAAPAEIFFGGKKLFELRLPAPGEHNLLNALYAVAAGGIYGLDAGAIKAALETFKLPAMRWETCRVKGALAINDAYNANPLSMRAALRNFEAMNSVSAKWLVLGGMRELGRAEAEQHAELGREVARSKAWRGLITVGELGRLIAESAIAAGMPREKVFICAGHKEAAEVLAGAAKAGDAALFKGSRLERMEEVLRLWNETK